MNYREVIEKIGGGSLHETARQLGLPVTTVNHWRLSQKVPEWRQEHIHNVAKRLGVKIEGGQNESR